MIHEARLLPVEAVHEKGGSNKRLQKDKTNGWTGRRKKADGRTDRQTNKANKPKGKPDQRSNRSIPTDGHMRAATRRDDRKSNKNVAYRVLLPNNRGDMHAVDCMKCQTICPCSSVRLSVGPFRLYDVFYHPTSTAVQSGWAGVKNKAKKKEGKEGLALPKQPKLPFSSLSTAAVYRKTKLKQFSMFCLLPSWLY